MKEIKKGFLRSLGFVGGSIVFVSLSALLAQSLTTFSSGDLISASTINANFTALLNRLDSPLPRTSSSSSAGFTTASTTFTNATNLNMTVTTSGSPLWVGLVSDNSGSSCVIGVGDSAAGSSHGVIILLRDGVEIARWALAQNAGGIGTLLLPCGTIWHIDSPGAGTYTYRIQGLVIGGTDTLSINNALLTAARFNET